jgi:small-conductance mechanosensitive channel
MFDAILHQTFFGNRILDYLICLAIFVIGFLVIRILRAIVFRQLRKWAEKTSATLDDFLIAILEKALLPLLYFGVFYLGLRSLSLNPGFSRAVEVIGVLFMTIIGVRFMVGIVHYTVRDVWLKKHHDPVREQTLKAILPAIKVVIWGLAIVFLLDNLGFKISAVVAGLGIGGVALALASQTLLKDLFSYFSILFDRPFEVGDFLILGDCLGTVEHIGIKTTRLRSLGGEQIVISNTDLTDSRVRNYKRMDERRVLFQIGVIYQTGLEVLKEIPAIIKSVIEGIEETRFDRAHFASYGDFSLVFEVVYYVLDRDYNKYMNIQQKINLRIREEFQKRGIEFAYPTQTLFLQRGDSAEPSSSKMV